MVKDSKVGFALMITMVIMLIIMYNYDNYDHVDNHDHVDTCDIYDTYDNLEARIKISRKESLGAVSGWLTLMPMKRAGDLAFLQKREVLIF